MKLKHITVLAAALTLGSCNYLDVVPEGTPTLDDIFSSSLQTERFLYTIYNYIPNYASYRYMPDMCAGGDIITGTNGQTRYFPYKSMLYDEENANNTYFGLWEATTSSPSGRTNYDMYKGIRYAYTLLNNLDKVPNMTNSVRSSIEGECWFLIGLLHWTLMEHYGPVVIVTKEISLNADESETLLPRSNWDDCAAFVSQCFDRAATLLPAVQPANELGRATSVAALAYKSRCLMYTASPLVNGNKDLASFVNYDDTPMISLTVDKEKWRTAREAVKEAIDLAERSGYKLFEDAASTDLSDAERGRNNYYKCFINEKWADAVEYLFALGDQTGAKNIQQYGGARQWNPENGDAYITTGFRNYMVPTLQLVETFLTEDGLPLWADPKTKDAYAANRLLTVGDDGIAELHKHRDPRFYATIGYDRGSYDINGKTITLRMRKGEWHGYTGNITHEYVSCTGYVLQKFISINTTYTESSKAISYIKYPLPYFRLAELYLDYAEADFEYTGKLSDEALGYLNKVRNRSGLPNFEDSWALAGGMPTGETLRTVLHQENMAELACEWRQYNNIRRWNIAKDIVGETPDVLNIEGTTAEDFYTIKKMKESGIRVFTYPKTNWFAIPMSEMEINFRLVQNPGY